MVRTTEELKRKINALARSSIQPNKKNKTVDRLNLVEYASWSTEQVCSLLVMKEKGGAGLLIEKVKPLYDASFDGASLTNIITYIQEKDKYFAMEKVNQNKDYQNVSQTTLENVVNWVDNFKTRLYHLLSDKTALLPTHIDIQLRTFDISAYIDEMLQKLPTHFKNSMQQWSASTKEAIKSQKSKLGSLYKKVFLPDHHNGFSNSTTQSWTNHFNELRIPKEKGKELADLLFEDVFVGRGDEFKNSMIAFIDLSTSGKTYTIFQLSNQKPSKSDSKYKKLFVINLVTGTLLFTRFLKYVDQEKGFETPCSVLELVSLLAYTVNICVYTLLERVPEATPIQFLKFIRNGGDLFLQQILDKLADADPKTLQSLNFNITNKLSTKGVKVVFSFDEAQLLLTHAKGRVDVDGELKGCLFHAIYQQIRQFNNPVFLGTTFSISNALLNVSKEGRKLVVPVIGSLQPWFLTDVETALSNLFNIEDIKKTNPEQVEMLCYLLSGSPENVSILHRVLLGESCHNSKTTLEKLRNAVEKVVETKKERSESRLKVFLNDSKLQDRETFLLKLLFKKECVFQNTEINQLEESINFPKSYSQAFIEKTIAFVVKTSKQSTQIFDIVDPIAAITFFESAFNLIINDMWKFMSENFSGNGEEFEFFMIMLLIHEGKLLQGESFTKSPLFNKARNMKLDEWYINTTSFLNDRNLSKNVLKEHKNNPGMWFVQLAHNHLRDCFIRPHSEMGPCGFFYLKNEEKYQLVTCAMTLVKDPLFDKTHPNKAKRMVETLSIHNIGKDKSGNSGTLNYSIPKNVKNTKTIGWIIAPNMNSNVFSSYHKDVNLIVTDRQAINDCLNKYKKEKYYNDMVCVWNKFK